MVYPGVKLKALCIADIFGRERVWMRKGGVLCTTEICLLFLANCESSNCNQLFSSLDNETFQTRTHTDTRDSMVLARHAWFPHKEWFCKSHFLKAFTPSIDKKGPRPGPLHSHLDTRDGYPLINHTYTVWVGANRWGFKTHTSSLWKSRHTISYMVWKQIHGRCKLLLQDHGPELRSSVFRWHYQPPL